MTSLQRRTFLTLAGGTAMVPRFAIAQTNNRPSITVAVQKITSSNTLTPAAEQSNVAQRIVNSYLELLIGQDYVSHLQPIPRLATSWKRIDYKTVELTLRQGVKFHNGDEMTADDVAFSFSPERLFGNTIPSGWTKDTPPSAAPVLPSDKQPPAQVPAMARAIWPSLVKVEVVDKYTVRFINATPDVTMEGRISAMGSQIISRRAYEEAPTWLSFAQKPIGTGPYKIRSYAPENELILDAHDEYWGGRPPIKTIRFVQVPEVSERVNGMLAGQYDFACDLSPDLFKQIDADPKLEVVGGLVPNIRISVFNKQDPILKDPRIRQAMTHSIDRQLIVDQLWLGHTKVPPGLQFEFYGNMFINGWTAPEFDLSKARALVKAAGYQGQPITYRLMNDYYTLQVENAQVLTSMWQQAGLNVKIEMKENWAQVWDTTGSLGVHDWSDSATFNDPVSSLPNQFGPHSTVALTNEWSNAEMYKLCNVLETSIDQATRKKAFARILMICEREDPAYTVLNQNATFTAKRRCFAWKPAPAFAMDFRAENWGKVAL